MFFSFSEKFSSLKVRILGAIFVIFFLAMGMVLFGVYTFQKDKLVELTSHRAQQLSDVIVAGLRSSMLQNDRSQILQSINTILQVAGTRGISIMNSSGRIVLSNDPQLSGRMVDMMSHPSCTPCHGNREDPHRTVVTEREDEQVISTVTPIYNEPACHDCHPARQELIGILLVESTFSRTASILAEMARRITMTGIAVFLVGAFLILYIVNRFFTRPLNILQQGFEQVGRGNFNHWVDVGTGGEIGYMADSFNVMSRAIGRNVRELREKTEEVAAHYTIVNSLSQTIDKKVLKEVAVDLLARILKADSVSLALVMEKNPDIFEIVRMQRGDSRHYHTFFNTAREAAGGTGCSLSSRDLVAWREGRLREMAYRDQESGLLIPLEHEKMSLGVICVQKPAGRKFSDAEKKIIPVLAHHVAISLANARLYEMAITDGLTTLYTKRHFEKQLHDLVGDFRRSKRGFCMLMLDLDHFKEVNDRYGHPLGDQVLVRIAEVIRSTIRHGDTAFRYGGEEFAVLLLGDDLEDAVRIAERIRTAVEKTFVQVEGFSPVSCTVSIGVACYPHHFSSAAELVKAADTALYTAKNKGRNRVEVYCSKDDPNGCY